MTGGSRGLGLDIVKNLLAETELKVLCLSRTSPDISDERLVHVPTDLTDIKSLPVILTREFSGRKIRTCVNNAGLGTQSILLTQHLSEIELVVACNLVAPILISKHAARAMLPYKRGQIINIASVVAHTGYNGLATYAATKAGLIGFTKSLARELGPANIAVNSISPGFMETDMTEGLSDRLGQIRRRSPVGELARTTDVAELILYLLQRNSPRHTGHDFVVDAGNSV